MANEFTYNGVTINYPDIKIISSVATYDESDTTAMFTTNTLRVTGTIQDDENNSVAANIAFFRQQLLIPQKILTVAIGDTPIFLGTDDAGGPKPRKCEITEIIGGGTFATGGRGFCFVTFEIEYAQFEGCSMPSNVIAHSYTASHALDNRFYTTRTIRGSIRVRQSADGNNNPDVLRGLIAPALPNGFQRTAMDFTVSMDGLSLNYSITDKEVFRVSPSSGCEWTGSFAQQINGTLIYSQINIEIKGHRQQDQFTMYQQAMLLIGMRIDWSKERLMQASIEEILHDNVVRVHATTQWAAPFQVDQTTQGLIPQGSKIFTGISGYSDIAAALGPYGTALTQAAKKIFYTACGTPINPQNIRYAAIPASDPGVLRTGGGPGTINTANDIGGNSKLSNVQKTFPYVDFRQELRYEQDNAVVLLKSTKAKSPGRVYQMANPSMTIYQVGTAMRTGRPPQIPSPQSICDGEIKTKKVTFGQPIAMGDQNTLLYSASWYYEILVPFVAADFSSSTDMATTASFIDTDVGQENPYAIPSTPLVNNATPTTLPGVKANVGIVVAHLSDTAGVVDPAT